MVALRTSNIRKYVAEAYAADEPLYTRWHVIAPAPLDACVTRTVSDLESMETLEFYVVIEDGKFVGYFGTEFHGTHVPTIFIMPAYRPRKRAFWALLKAFTAPEFQAAIYSKNEPCMRFYERMGGHKFTSFSTPSGPGAAFQFKVGV